MVTPTAATSHCKAGTMGPTQVKCAAHTHHRNVDRAVADGSGWYDLLNPAPLGGADKLLFRMVLSSANNKHYFCFLFLVATVTLACV